MKYKKGLVIENACWICYNPKMKIYRIKKYKDTEGSKAFIWCKCEQCGAVDDIIREEN